jgi:DNA mismatch repair ATPase MutS
VEEIYARFKQGAVKDYRVKFANYSSMDHVQAHILQLVARLFPDVFASLHRYRANHGSFVDLYVRTFDREVQFYLAYLEHLDWLRNAGLPFCYPKVSAESRAVFAQEAFDLALANTLVPQGLPIVRNDFTLADPERIFVVTGANQGGKTTFARMFGQLHYFAALGFPVPARRARLCLPDRIFTHFEKQEDLTTLRGKLEDELVRVHEILHEATSRSVVIMNESFTATTLADALYIGTAVLEQVIEIGSLCVYVTFVDELSSLGDTTVSVVATVVPQDPDVRTYKVERKQADGRAHAVALAHKYGLSYDSLKERVTR